MSTEKRTQYSDSMLRNSERKGMAKNMTTLIFFFSLQYEKAKHIFGLLNLSEHLIQTPKLKFVVCTYWTLDLCSSCVYQTYIADIPEKVQQTSRHVKGPNFSSRRILSSCHHPPSPFLFFSSSTIVFGRLGHYFSPKSGQFFNRFWPPPPISLLLLLQHFFQWIKPQFFPPQSGHTSQQISPFLDYLKNITVISQAFEGWNMI